MNKARRSSITRIVHTISEICDELDDIIMEEEDAAYRVPENLRGAAETKLSNVMSFTEKAQTNLIQAQVYLEKSIK